MALFEHTRAAVCVAFLVLLCGCQRARNPIYVTIGYSEQNTNCIGCPRFRAEIRAPGLGEFHCDAGCGAPGMHRFRMTERGFARLMDRFEQAKFSEIPRLDVKRVVVDAMVIRTSISDELGIHEVVDSARGNDTLTELEHRVRTALPVQDFVSPTIAQYEQMVKDGWKLTTVGEDQENAVTAAVDQDNLDVLRWLLEHGVPVTAEARKRSMFHPLSMTILQKSAR